MKLTQLEKNVFAVLFASGDPMEQSKLCEVLCVTPTQLNEGLKSLQDNLNQWDLSVEIRRLGDSVQVCSRPEYKAVIKSALDIRRNTPLSPAAMEVLAIIAYNQPVTRGFVEQIRGVDSSSVVIALAEKGLVEEAGRMELPGRPIAYKTTYNFLRCFGLSCLDELPKVDSLDMTDYDSDAQVTFEGS